MENVWKYLGRSFRIWVVQSREFSMPEVPNAYRSFGWRVVERHLARYGRTAQLRARITVTDGRRRSVFDCAREPKELGSIDEKMTNRWSFAGCFCLFCLCLCLFIFGGHACSGYLRGGSRRRLSAVRSKSVGEVPTFRGTRSKGMIYRCGKGNWIRCGDWKQRVWWGCGCGCSLGRGRGRSVGWGVRVRWSDMGKGIRCVPLLAPVQRCCAVSIC
jgi:hypothetical protein